MYTPEQAVEQWRIMFNREDEKNTPSLDLFSNEWMASKKDSTTLPKQIQKFISLQTLGIFQLYWPGAPTQYLGAVGWVIPLTLEDKKINEAAISSYWENIKQIIHKKEAAENMAPRFEGYKFFEITPWNFMLEFQDIRLAPVRNDNTFYLYSLQFLAEEKWTNTDLSILWGLVKKEDKIQLIDELRKMMHEKKFE